VPRPLSAQIINCFNVAVISLCHCLLRTALKAVLHFRVSTRLGFELAITVIKRPKTALLGSVSGYYYVFIAVKFMEPCWRRTKSLMCDDSQTHGLFVYTSIRLHALYSSLLALLYGHLRMGTKGTDVGLIMCVCLYVHILQLGTCWTYFYKMLCGRHAIGGYPKFSSSIYYTR
jgi:hypothetical protein